MRFCNDNCQCKCTIKNCLHCLATVCVAKLFSPSMTAAQNKLERLKDFFVKKSFLGLGRVGNPGTFHCVYLFSLPLPLRYSGYPNKLECLSLANISG
jgi:hypothetical protein